MDAYKRRFRPVPQVTDTTWYMTCAHLAAVPACDLETIWDNNVRVIHDGEGTMHNRRAIHDALKMLTKVNKEYMVRQAREIRTGISHAKAELRRLRIPKN